MNVNVFFGTTTIGAAPSAVSIFSMIPSFSIFANSSLTLSKSAYGIGRLEEFRFEVLRSAEFDADALNFTYFCAENIFVLL